MKNVKRRIKKGRLGRPAFGEIQRIDRIGPFLVKDIAKIEIAYRPFWITQYRWTWLGPRRYRYEGYVFDHYIHMKYDKIYFVRRWVFEPDVETAMKKAFESAQMAVRVNLLRRFDDILTSDKNA